MLTHCNTGSLATCGVGTALGVVRVLKEIGKLGKICGEEDRVQGLISLSSIQGQYLRPLLIFVVFIYYFYSVFLLFDDTFLSLNVTIASPYK